jgi:Insertion element 4 transposase N-terminal
LPANCAIGAAVVRVTRTITVAAGVFAPGHLGELTRIVPFELVDAVLEEARARERRVRLLPSRVGVYFALALCLFPQDGYPGAWARLTAALDGLGLAAPSLKALRCLRRRVGAAPLRLLFEALAGPLGRPRTPARNITATDDADIAGDIGRAVLASLNPPRRPRVCPRRVKSPLSRWAKHPPGKPATSKQITSINTEIDHADRKPATRRRKNVTTATGPQVPGIGLSPR